MALVKFASICDACGNRSAEYEAYPSCRECGHDICLECQSKDSLDEESNTCLCWLDDIPVVDEKEDNDGS
jgi:hypothetical protein